MQQVNQSAANDKGGKSSVVGGAVGKCKSAAGGVIGKCKDVFGKCADAAKGLFKGKGGGGAAGESASPKSKKKKLIQKILVGVLVAALAVGIFAARELLRPELDLTGNISYKEQYVVAGTGSNFSATVTAGLSERTFLTDGRAMDVIEFTRLSVVALNAAYSKALSFNFDIEVTGGQNFSGIINRDSRTMEFIALLDVPPSDILNIASIVIHYANNRTETVTFANMLEGRLTAQQAYEIAIDFFEDLIAQNTHNGQLNREIFIRFVRGFAGEEPYYWYVAFISSDTDYWAVLLDSKTGEVSITRGVE